MSTLDLCFQVHSDSCKLEFELAVAASMDTLVALTVARRRGQGPLIGQILMVVHFLVWKECTVWGSTVAADV